MVIARLRVQFQISLPGKNGATLSTTFVSDQLILEMTEPPSSVGPLVALSRSRTPFAGGCRREIHHVEWPNVPDEL